MVQKVLFNLKELVEEMIKPELKLADYGALMHNGWSKFGTHYVGLFAQYNRTVTQNISKITPAILMPTNVSFVMRSMCGVSEEEEEGNDSDSDKCDEITGLDKEATNFTVEVHANFFRDIIKSYGIMLEDWVVCQVSFLFEIL